MTCLDRAEGFDLSRQASLSRLVLQVKFVRKTVKRNSPLDMIAGMCRTLVHLTRYHVHLTRYHVCSVCRARPLLYVEEASHPRCPIIAPCRAGRPGAPTRCSYCDSVSGGLLRGLTDVHTDARGVYPGLLSPGSHNEDEDDGDER